MDNSPKTFDGLELQKEVAQAVIQLLNRSDFKGSELGPVIRCYSFLEHLISGELVVNSKQSKEIVTKK